MWIRLAVVSLLVACSSVSTGGPAGGGDGGGGGGGDGGGGGADAAPPNAVMELAGTWDVIIDADPLCTATFGTDILVECPSQSEPEVGCILDETVKITGTWSEGLRLSIESELDYSGTCSATRVDEREVVATMSGTRTATSPASGLWQAVGGTWHVEGEDPTELPPDVSPELTCEAMFTPGASAANIHVTCTTPWEDSDADGCQTRGLMEIIASYDGSAFTITVNPVDEKMMAGACVAPFMEAGDSINMSATRL